MLSPELQTALAKMRADGYRGEPTIGQLQRYGLKPDAPLVNVKPSTAALSEDQLKDHFTALAEEAEANKSLPFDKLEELFSIVGLFI